MKTSEPSPKKEPETVQHSHVSEQNQVIHVATNTFFWWTWIVSCCIQTSSGTKIRRRRKVLKSRTFKDEEGCIGRNKIMKLNLIFFTFFNILWFLPIHPSVHPFIYQSFHQSLCLLGQQFSIFQFSMERINHLSIHLFSFVHQSISLFIPVH